MSKVLVCLLFALNAAMTAFWLCQLVEVLLALPVAVATTRNGRAGMRLFFILVGQLSKVLLGAVISSIAVLEVSAFSALATWYPVWPMHSAGFGVAATVLALGLSPRFREEISSGAHRRVLSNVRSSYVARRFFFE